MKFYHHRLSVQPYNSNWIKKATFWDWSMKRKPHVKVTKWGVRCTLHSCLMCWSLSSWFPVLHTCASWCFSSKMPWGLPYLCPFKHIIFYKHNFLYTYKTNLRPCVKLWKVFLFGTSRQTFNAYFMCWKFSLHHAQGRLCRVTSIGTYSSSMIVLIIFRNIPSDFRMKIPLLILKIPELHNKLNNKELLNPEVQFRASKLTCKTVTKRTPKLPSCICKCIHRWPNILYYVSSGTGIVRRAGDKTII